jgi:hypothetical protein
MDGLQASGLTSAAVDSDDVTRWFGSAVTVLNATSALYRGTFSRQRSDGVEISRLTATYLVTEGAAGRRISVLAVHSP